MTEIIVNGEHTKIITNDLEIYIKGDYKIEKKTSDAETTEYIKSLKDNYLKETK